MPWLPKMLVTKPDKYLWLDLSPGPSTHRSPHAVSIPDRRQILAAGDSTSEVSISRKANEIKELWHFLNPSDEMLLLLSLE